MKLEAFVSGQPVGILEPVGDFKSVFAYHPDAANQQLVSLTMPVRTESYVWDDVLHPIFQMNLPEGYLLQVLQEAFGPHIGANPTALLAVIGRNMVGRLQVAPPDSSLTTDIDPVDVRNILHGDNGPEAFAELVRQHARCGVSGVEPKFLDTDVTTVRLSAQYKRTLLTSRHIVKGSAHAFPYIALNEHFCMAVAARVMPTAKTTISDDGQVVVVDRFDISAEGKPHYALEDYCSLLGMRPASKYETTWERIANATRDHVPGAQQRQALQQCATILLLSYALRNADCHAKNIALMYTSRADVQVAPAFDMVTTVVYEGYEKNPPALAFMGAKTWTPGKRLREFIVGTFGMPLRLQVRLLEEIGDAMTDVAPAIRGAMRDLPGFADVGARMLWTWNAAFQDLRDRRCYSLPAPEAF